MRVPAVGHPQVNPNLQNNVPSNSTKIFKVVLLAFGAMVGLRVLNDAVKIIPTGALNTILIGAAIGAAGIFVASNRRRQDDIDPEIIALTLAIDKAERLQKDFPGLIIAPVQEATQYDIPGDRPAACTFHAIQAMIRISNDFAAFAELIRNRDTMELSKRQKDILQSGLTFYNSVIAQQNDVVQGADLSDIRQHIPGSLKFHEIQDQVDGTFVNRLNRVVDFLYENEDPVVWIKNGNDESFAVIKQGTNAIIFDSHKNEMILAEDNYATMSALRTKLEQYKTERDGVDLTPFAYALGLTNFPGRALNIQNSNHPVKVILEIPMEIEEDIVFKSFVCPLTTSPVIDPVLDPTNLATIHERAAIERYLADHTTSLNTQKPLTRDQLIPLPKVRELIRQRLEFYGKDTATVKKEIPEEMIFAILEAIDELEAKKCHLESTTFQELLAVVQSSTLFN